MRFQFYRGSGVVCEVAGPRDAARPVLACMCVFICKFRIAFNM